MCLTKKLNLEFLQHKVVELLLQMSRHCILSDLTMNTIERKLYFGSLDVYRFHYIFPERYAMKEGVFKERVVSNDSGSVLSSL